MVENWQFIVWIMEALFIRIEAGRGNDMNHEKYLKFGMELAKVISNYEQCATYSLLSENRFRYGDYSIGLEELADLKKVTEAMDYVITEKYSLKKFRQQPYDCYLGCEGDLYEALYYYEAQESNLLGTEKEAEQLYKQMQEVCDKYHLCYELEGGGLGFYEEERYE